MRLVCTDMDRTLLPNGEQSESTHARPLLWHLLTTHEVKLAYVTGRDLDRVLEAIDQYELPAPDMIVADVGTRLYKRDDDGWVLCTQWQAELARQWQGVDSSTIATCLSDIDTLLVQEPERQSRFKQSFYYDEAVDESALHQQVSLRLAEQGVQATLVVSHDPQMRRGLLDVLPRSASKREAVLYMQSLCALASHDVLFAGDSGNDLSAICADYPSVLVANADQNTRTRVLAHIKHTKNAKTTYLAQGALPIAGADKLNGCYAAGIVEALVHFRPRWRSHLQDPAWVGEALSGAPASPQAFGKRTG